MTDNFLPNESNFFMCSQFRLEENFFKCVVFFKCILGFTKLKKTIHCMLHPCSNLSPRCFFQDWITGNEFRPSIQSAMSTMSWCFCNLVIARETSLKCENKQLQLLLKREERWICGVQDEVLLLLKICSKLTQRLF